MQRLLIHFFCFFSFFIATDVNAQLYHKVNVNLIGRDILELAKAGIETDHGLYVKNRYFISDFSETELKVIKDLHFETEILIKDVSAFYADENRKSELLVTASRNSECQGLNAGEYNYKTPDQYRAGSMGGYFTYSEMIEILDSMIMRYPNLISPRQEIDSITTHNGNHLFYIKLSDFVEEDEATEPKVLYTALHHAREPNSLSQMIFYLWYLLENYGTDPAVTKIVNETQLYFVPCVNPDGYLQNQSTNPNGGGLWRKNMWKDEMGALKGVDLNRNYGHYWGFDDVGSSTNPNSQTYRGVSGFSEPETRAVRALCLQHDFKIAQNYHTFGNYLIHPWGYNDKPTDEDVLFKSMGSIMNRENNFKMGTGSETVGYVVNGDSDDWMYGANDEKNAIYAFTPEVGPSFWPAKVDIDYLNRSCLWMNMATALLTLNYYSAEEVVKSSFLTPDNRDIFIKVARVGLKDGKCIVRLKSKTQGVMVTDLMREVNLNLAKSEVIDFKLEIAPDLLERELSFVLEVDNDGVISTTTITKLWNTKNFIAIQKDEFNNKDAFKSDDWSLTNEAWYSGPSSLTDSPSANYEKSKRSTVSFNEPIDLSKVEEAILSFYAKWDIEDNYDFVQVQASTNNSDFIPLCGLYSNAGSEFQEFNSPLYDGTQKDWILEEINLTDFVGKPQVWIRFVFSSDELEERDGFYVDDLTIKVVPKTISSTVDDKAGLIVYPTLSDGKQIIYLHYNPSNEGDLQMSIVDLAGRQVASLPVVSGVADLSKTNLQVGLYTYTLTSGGQSKGRGKLVIK